mmetsp:Transcript_15708/g.17475  ORF Transcript_15708/g.17475 Transcript_15708/m.17475 type:complete len:263 (+) Transcript_15708:765-1553(+)
MSVSVNNPAFSNLIWEVVITPKEEMLEQELEQGQELVLVLAMSVLELDLQVIHQLRVHLEHLERPDQELVEPNELPLKVVECNLIKEPILPQALQPPQLLAPILTTLTAIATIPQEVVVLLVIACSCSSIFSVLAGCPSCAQKSRILEVLDDQTIAIILTKVTFDHLSFLDPYIYCFTFSPSYFYPLSLSPLYFLRVTMSTSPCLTTCGEENQFSFIEKKHPRISPVSENPIVTVEKEKYSFLHLRERENSPAHSITPMFHK